MSLQYDALHDALVSALEQLRGMEGLLQDNTKGAAADRDALWGAIAELRDELHASNAALANRIEGIVRL